MKSKCEFCKKPIGAGLWALMEHQKSCAKWPRHIDLKGRDFTIYVGEDALKAINEAFYNKSS